MGQGLKEQLGTQLDDTFYTQFGEGVKPMKFQEWMELNRVQLEQGFISENQNLFIDYCDQQYRLLEESQ